MEIETIKEHIIHLVNHKNNREETLIQVISLLESDGFLDIRQGSSFYGKQQISDSTIGISQSMCTDYDNEDEINMLSGGRGKKMEANLFDPTTGSYRDLKTLRKDGGAKRANTPLGPPSDNPLGGAEDESHVHEVHEDPIAMFSAFAADANEGNQYQPATKQDVDMSPTEQIVTAFPPQQHEGGMGKSSPLMMPTVVVESPRTSQLHATAVGKPGVSSSPPPRDTTTAIAQAEEECDEKSTSLRKHNRRIAISAAPIGINDAKEFKPRVIEKGHEEESFISEIIQSSQLFSAMEPEDQEIIIKASEKEDVDAGVDILTQGGQTNNKFYMIAEGEIEVQKNKKRVATITVGQYFGELELMYNVPTNAATIRTVTRCVLYSLDQETYQNVVLNVSLKKRELYKELLNNVGFLKQVSDYDKMTIADSLLPDRFNPEQHITKFGEKGKWMHLISEGQARVVGRKQGQKVDIITLGPGDIVGELEFLFNHLNVADVIAITKVKTAKISRKHFETCMGGGILEELKRYIAESHHGLYKHYIGAAEDHVKKQITEIQESKASKKVASGDKLTINAIDIDHRGEICVCIREADAAVPSGSVDNKMLAAVAADPDLKALVYRFPLLPLHESCSFAMIGVSETGVITFWNKAIEFMTNYPSSEVIGQSLYSFLVHQKDQTELHAAVGRAVNWTGNVDGFANRQKQSASNSFTVTVARADGLTKLKLTMDVIPPVVAQKRDDPEMLMILCSEVKDQRHNASSQQVDQSNWFVEQVKEIISEHNEICAFDSAVGGGAYGYGAGPEAMSPSHISSSDPSASQFFNASATTTTAGNSMAASAFLLPVKKLKDRLETVMKKFEALQQVAIGSTEHHQVNVRQLIGHVVSQYRPKSIANGQTISTVVSEAVQQEVLVDTEMLPKCLNYALSNSVNHTGKTSIEVRVTIEEELGFEYIQFEFQDNGPGLDPKLLRVFHKPPPKYMNAMLRVKKCVEKLGGSMAVESKRDVGTSVKFRVPYNPVEPEDDMNDAAAFGASELTQSMTVGGSSSGSGMPKTYTTLLAEEKHIHRNMLCSNLWERKHAVIPANSWKDIQEMIENADVLVIDPLQPSLANDSSVGDPITYLRQYVSRKPIVITSETFDKDTRLAFHAAGFLTLNKPFTASQATRAIRKAEQAVGEIQVEKDKIDHLRETFSTTKRGKWDKGKLLGKGAFGEVHEATDVLTGGKMAVKALKVGKGMNKHVLMNEIEIMCRLQHPNIIHYFYAEDLPEENSINVFMEFAAGGTLDGVLATKGKYTREELVPIVRDIVEGLIYVHGERFVHSDIKTANVLLGADGKCKLGDFGTAKRIEEGELCRVMQGTPQYMAPEVMAADEAHGYDFSADVWSLGCVVLELVTGRPPFSHLAGCGSSMGITSYMSGLEEQKLETPDLAPLFDQHVSVYEFVAACVKVKPAERPTARALLEMNLLNEGGSQNEAEAIKALQKAQFIHKLSTFVAFYDPDEQPDDVLAAIHGRSKKKRRESAFFDSDDEDEPESDGKAESNFFDDSEDENSVPSVASSNSEHEIPLEPGEEQEQEEEVPLITSLGCASDTLIMQPEDYPDRDGDADGSANERSKTRSPAPARLATRDSAETAFPSDVPKDGRSQDENGKEGEEDNVLMSPLIPHHASPSSKDHAATPTATSSTATQTPTRPNTTQDGVLVPHPPPPQQQQQYYQPDGALSGSAHERSTAIYSSSSCDVDSASYNTMRLVVVTPAAKQQRQRQPETTNEAAAVFNAICEAQQHAQVVSNRQVVVLHEAILNLAVKVQSMKGGLGAPQRRELDQWLSEVDDLAGAQYRKHQQKQQQLRSQRQQQLLQRNGKVEDDVVDQHRIHEWSLNSNAGSGRGGVVVAEQRSPVNFSMDVEEFIARDLEGVQLLNDALRNEANM